MAAANAYRFTTHWLVRGDIQEVAAILEDIESLPRWWPAVYLEVRTLESGAPGGVGKLVLLHTKGWLPYSLRWRLRVVESRSPHGFTITADGDFVGRGVWTLKQDGEAVLVSYDWRIRAEKPLLRFLSFALKPLFAANHRWAMARGEESLALELRRRATRDAGERERLPSPPAPTWYCHRVGRSGRPDSEPPKELP